MKASKAMPNEYTGRTEDDIFINGLFAEEEGVERDDDG